MTDGTLRAILARIILEPGEDLHRLVFADALDERALPTDAARAEFIRVQVELARTPDSFGRGKPMYQDIHTGHYGPTPVDRLFIGFSGGTVANPRHVELTARELELFKGNEDWASLFGCGPLGWFRRGFVESAACTAADFVRHADALLWHPEREVKCDAKGCVDGTIGRPRPGDVGGQWMGRMCDRCDGSCFITRPRPPLTAQPICKVTLTTSPNIVSLRDAPGGYIYGWAAGEFSDEEFSPILEVREHTVANAVRNDPVVLRLLNKRWPGVEFSLPDHLVGQTYDDPFPDVPWGGGL